MVEILVRSENGRTMKVRSMVVRFKVVRIRWRMVRTASRWCTKAAKN
ncbi:hypothetical protein [Noviherbaspirillum galbum]|uniref:Uncharacterized protein n=1 Tax=Noviherbaspirillum galbum TaxID=2709383 RepID=A0A6B3SXH9_9BURK|nr:hypothetical protein [Noviherbaspirillum galbum]NEX63846.1 hypothetical protein [Noviherbaspirillum galbum]